MVKKILIGVCVLVTCIVAYYVIAARTLMKAEQKGLIQYTTNE